MAYLKTLDILGILEDFYTKPLYDGKGLWDRIKNVLEEVKDSSLSGFLLLSRINEMFISFFDSGVMLESLKLEEDRIYSFGYMDFIKEFSAISKVKSYGYVFYPHNSETVIALSLLHRSSRILDSTTPYPQKILDELQNIGFSGILRVYNPVQVSMVFLSGAPFGIFSRGKMLNLNETFGKQGIYEMKAFSIEGPLAERNYEYHLGNFLQRINRIYAKYHIDSLKFREKMLSYADTEPFIDPILGFVEPGDKEIAIHLPAYQGLRVLPTICDILMDIKPNLRDDLESLKSEVEAIL